MNRICSILAMTAFVVAFLLLGVIAPGQDPDTQLQIMGIGLCATLIGVVFILAVVLRGEE